MKTLYAFLIVLGFSMISHAQATPEQMTATIQYLLSLYGSDCSLDDINTLASELNQAAPKILIKAAFEKNYCAENKKADEQSKKCYQFLDAELGKRVRESLRKLRLECKLNHHWVARLAANNCQVSRDIDQVKEDNKSGFNAIEKRGYCSYKVKRCESSSVSDLEKFVYNCSAVPLDGTDQFTCLSETKLNSCETKPLKGKTQFTPVVKPAMIYGEGTSVDPDGVK